MANIKIAQLTNQLTLSDTDTIIVETATSTNKMSVGTFKMAIGAIVDSGYNENGDYIKFGDGTMIARRKISLDENKYLGAPNDSVFKLWNYPVAFVGAPNVVCTVETVTKTYLWYVSLIAIPNNLNAKIYASYSGYVRNSQEDIVTVNAIAIGRWK